MIKKILLISFVFSLFFFTSNVFGQGMTSVTVFPTKQDIKVDSGSPLRTQINFKNGGDQVLIGNLKVADYEVVDKQGSVRIIEDGNPKPKYSASSWITLPDDYIAIPKNGIVSANILINPPLDLASCGYYAMVYFQPIQEDKSNSLNVSAKIGSLLNFIVDNKVCKEKLIISRLEAPAFLENGPIPLNFDLLNEGDIHLIAKGSIITTDLLKQLVNQQSIKELKIFPEKAKEYNTDIGKTWMFGRYKILMNISYGTTASQVISKIVYVWVFPWRLAILVLLSLVILFLFIKNLYKVTKNKKVDADLGIKNLKEQIRKRE